MTVHGTQGEPAWLSTNMDVLTAIRERRSIRRFTGDPVSDQQLNTILHAGLCAPTARNLRPFHFVLIQMGICSTNWPRAKSMPACSLPPPQASPSAEIKRLKTAWNTSTPTATQRPKTFCSPSTAWA